MMIYLTERNMDTQHSKPTLENLRIRDFSMKECIQATGHTNTNPIDHLKAFRTPQKHPNVGKDYIPMDSCGKHHPMSFSWVLVHSALTPKRPRRVLREVCATDSFRSASWCGKAWHLRGWPRITDEKNQVTRWSMVQPVTSNGLQPTRAPKMEVTPRTTLTRGRCIGLCTDICTDDSRMTSIL